MIETEVQSLVVSVVRDRGGAATKLSNRFLVGVSDLLIKLPKLPACLLEVKLQKTRTFQFKNNAISPDVTVLQYQFLLAFVKAGMTCGVASFIQGPRGKADLRLLLKRVTVGQSVDSYRVGDHLMASEHVALGGHGVRDDMLYRMLQQFATNTLEFRK